MLGIHSHEISKLTLSWLLLHGSFSIMQLISYFSSRFSRKHMKRSSWLAAAAPRFQFLANTWSVVLHWPSCPYSTTQDIRFKGLPNEVKSFESETAYVPCTVTNGIPRGIRCLVEMLPCFHGRQHSNKTKREAGKSNLLACIWVFKVVKSNDIVA